METLYWMIQILIKQISMILGTDFFSLYRNWKGILPDTDIGDSIFTNTDFGNSILSSSPILQFLSVHFLKDTFLAAE